ncbi:unnamed protein product, partial [Durusdinium trenchii]
RSRKSKRQSPESLTGFLGAVFLLEMGQIHEWLRSLGFLTYCCLWRQWPGEQHLPHTRATCVKGRRSLAFAAKKAGLRMLPLVPPWALPQLQGLTDAISKTTSDDIALEEREASIQEAGRILTGKAILNLPLALRQEVEVWHSRQQERLRLAKSMEAAVNRATSLEAEAPPVDALGILLSRAKLAGSGDHEALLAEAARRASAFQEELDRQRLKLQTRRKVDEGHQP